MSPHLKFCGRIDFTRVFRLESKPDYTMFHELIPNSSEEISPEKVSQVFQTLALNLSRQNDHNGLFTSRIQNAAMVAYNGNKKVAKKMLIKRELKAKLAIHRKRVKEALNSPTYDVNGPILL